LRSVPFGPWLDWRNWRRLNPLEDVSEYLKTRPGLALPTPAQWSIAREIIRNLDAVDRRPIDEVQQILENEHGIWAT
jgi:hypothetical protein